MAEQSETLKHVKPTETQPIKDNNIQPVSECIVHASSVPIEPLTSTQPSTCTPLTTVNPATTNITENNAAGLLFFLNSACTSQVTTPNTCTSGTSTVYSNAVFVPQPVNISILPQIQNVMSINTKQAMCNGNENNVIEKAMNLADLSEISGEDSNQHPVTNAALTLVSLGSTVGQPVQEIVIDESGRSTFAPNSNLDEVSVTVESEGSVAGTTSKSQEDSGSLCTVVVGSLCDNTSDGNTGIPDSKNDKVIREVITQTGGGSGEVVILKSSTKAKEKSISALMTEQSMERKRIAELRDTHRNLAVDKERPFSCEKCDKKFITKHDVKRHLIVHSEIKPYSCETCGKSFRTSNELNLHIPVHNKNTPYKCEFCSKEFRTKGCFKSHIKYHIGDKRHKCEICDRAFVKSADLKRHVAGHNNEKKYKCEECDSAFTRSDNLKAHMLLHSREKVVTCDKCNKEFINTVYLKRHMHIHKQAKKKPYECQWCPKTYEQLEGLRRHIRQHVGDEKFVCEHCAKKFITAIQLKRHLWLSHEQNSPYRRSIL